MSSSRQKRRKTSPRPRQMVVVEKKPKVDCPMWRLGYLWLPLIGPYYALHLLQKLLPLPALLRHTYVVAKSGAGKSELLKLLLLRLKFRRKWYKWWWHEDERVTVFFLDPHGEAAEQVARIGLFHRRFRCCSAASPLVYLSPEFRNEGTPTLNPFELPSRKMSAEALSKRAENLSQVFAQMLSRGNSDLSLPMFTILRAMILVLLTKGLRSDFPATFFDLERFLVPERNADLLEFGSSQMPAATVRHFFRFEFGQSRFGGTRFSLQVKLASLLHSAAFRRMLCQPRSSWRPEHFFRSGKMVLLNASQTALGTEVTEIYGRTVVALLHLAAIERGFMKGFRPTFLVLDEANTFLTPSIAAMLEQLRKYGLHLVLANQLLGQGGMSPAVAKSLVGNTSVRLCGIAGKHTRQHMAAECQVPQECLEGLRTGEFFLRAEGHRPVRIRVPKFFVGSRRGIGERQWQQFLRLQREQWYRQPAAQAQALHSAGGELAEEIEAARVSGTNGIYLSGKLRAPRPAMFGNRS